MTKPTCTLEDSVGLQIMFFVFFLISESVQSKKRFEPAGIIWLHPLVIVCIVRFVRNRWLERQFVHSYVHTWWRVSVQMWQMTKLSPRNNFLENIPVYMGRESLLIIVRFNRKLWDSVKSVFNVFGYLVIVLWTPEG
jgi:hypothetical protein